MFFLLTILLSFNAHAARYFAEVDANDVVLRVIVAEPEFISTMTGKWIETFIDGGARKNYAGPGHKHDKTDDAFFEPAPYQSWVLDKSNYKWKAPKEKPTDAEYDWDESKQDWKKVK